MRITEIPSAFHSLEMVMRAQARRTVSEREDSPVSIVNESVRVYIDRATDIADSVSVQVRNRDGGSYYGIVSDHVTVDTEGEKPKSVTFGNREQTLTINDDGSVIFQRRVDVRV